MTFAPLDHLPASVIGLILVTYFTAGLLIGLLYFNILWSNAQRLAQGGRLMTIIAAMIVRLVILGVALILASREGTMPLLLMAFGIIMARFAVVRHVEAIMP